MRAITSGSVATRKTITRFSNSPVMENSSSKLVKPASPKAATARGILGRPALAIVDESTHEFYVADGYGNKRIVVFDARTGEYRRHWGAYGAKPDDADPGKYDPAAPTAKQFRNPVHCVRSRARRAGLRLRPGQRPLPGVPQGRQFRDGIRAGTRTRASPARSGTSYYPKTQSRNTCLWPTGPTMKSTSCYAATAKRSDPSAGRAATPANSTGCMR